MCEIKSINPDGFCVRVASGEALGDFLGPYTVGINILVPTPDEELSYRIISSLGRRSKVLQNIAILAVANVFQIQMSTV